MGIGSGGAEDFGAIAQLGERLRGTQEVGGSIPPSSTNRRLWTRYLDSISTECVFEFEVLSSTTQKHNIILVESNLAPWIS